MPEKSSFTLIVPCYNESDCIPHFEKELGEFHKEFTAQFPGEKKSVILVDNNSTDGSFALLQELQRKYDFLTVTRCPQQGYGAALKHGFAQADAPYLAFLDLDNTYPLLSLLPMWRRLKEQNLDIVYGARIHSGSEIPWLRSVGNRMYAVLLRWLLRSPLSDVCSGMRIFRAERLPEILRLPARDLSFSIEFTATAVAQKWRIGELPIAYRERVGESKLSVVRDGVLFLLVVIRKWLS